MAKNIEFMGAIFPDVPSVKLPQQGGGLVSFDDTTDADATEGDIAQGKTAYVNGAKLTGTASGGGGGGIGTLLATKPLGQLSTTSTSSVYTEQNITINNAADYDLIITEVFADTATTERHIATISLFYMTASANIEKKSGVSAVSRFLIFNSLESGATASKYISTGYGVYAGISSSAITDGAITLPIYMRYNSTYSRPIDGNYTVNAYGVNLYDLMGD